MSGIPTRLRSLLRHVSSPRASKGAKKMEVKAASTSAQSKHYDVVIVGGGNSAGYACKTLVDLKWKGTLAIVSAEPVAPYERPALTKAFLHPPGAKVRARLPGFHTSVGGGGDRQTPEWYTEHGFDLLLSTKATGIDLASKTLKVAGADGERTISFGKLVMATGASALSPGDIKMNNAGLGNVFTIREEHDALEMVNALESMQGGDDERNIVIVGGGYIGMEAAAALSGWGFTVTMVYPEDSLMKRLFPAAIAEVFEAVFRARGIKTVSNARVTGMVPSDADKTKVGGVALGSGETLPADAVVFGVGARPNVQLAEGTDLAKGEGRVGGLAVNGDFQTSNQDVYAIGDIAALDGKQRFEHVDFCRKSAARAATALASGKSQGSFDYLPYFYSRLFEYTSAPLVFQFYGDSDLSEGQEVETFGPLEAAARAGASESVPAFGAAWLGSGRKIRGAMLCNATPEQYQRLKESVESGAELSEAFVADLLSESDE